MASVQGASDSGVAALAPLLRRRLAEKGAAGEELEDLCAEALGRIAAAERAGAPRPSDAEAYARVVADRVFADHLRRTRPNWYRLKRRVVYLLDEKTSGGLFARWQLRVEWLGGFARWRGRGFRATAAYSRFRSDRSEFGREATDAYPPRELRLPELLAQLFRWLDTPVEVDELTTHVAALQGIEDLSAVSFEGLEGERAAADPSCGPEATVLSALESERRRVRLWEEVRELPPRQRAALLLGMERDGLLLLLAGTATGVAGALEIPVPEFVEVWRKLPLPDAAIGARLGATTLQVSNLRKCARERLARRLRKGEEW